MTLVDELVTFYPPRRVGILFHLVVIGLLLAAAGWGLWNASRAAVGPEFLVYLLPLLAALILTPLLAYRLYTLRNASYQLGRDAICLQWGLRVERIPADAVLWVHPVEDLEIPLRIPWLRWPGAVLGRGRLPDNRPVEFMASQTRRLILIGTAQRAFAVSPEDPQAFIQAYQRFVELGSLNPVAAEVVYPTFLFARVWRAPTARWLLLLGALANLGLLIASILAVPRHPQISLGFTPFGGEREPVAGIQLLFLPVFSLLTYLFNGGLGLFFYRSEEERPWAYLLWVMADLVVMLFLAVVFFILRGG